MADVIKLEGLVIDHKEKKPFKGATITAYRSDAQVKVETDDKGKFVLFATPGKWKVSASAEGFREPEAFVYNFQKDTADLNFELEEGYTILGEILDECDGSPEAGVVMEATPKADEKAKPLREVSGTDGKFTFKNLAAGDWKVDGEPKEKSIRAKTVKLGPKNASVRLMALQEMNHKDRNAGIFLFFILLALLGGLIWSYLALHAKYPAGVEVELAGYIAQVEKVGATADAAIAEQKSAADAEPAEEPTPAPSADADASEGAAEETAVSAVQLLRLAVNSMKENWDLISGDIYSLSAGQKKQIDLLISGAVTSAAADKVEETQLGIVNLLEVLKKQQNLYLWAEPPYTYLEVLYWSLAGILVSVFFTVGFYLRKKTFIASGIWMHISHILAVPVTALVVVFIISLLKLTVQIENSEVVINLDDPRLLVAISFIISVRPWAILDFVKETGGSLFDKVKERFGGTASGQEGTTKPPEPK